MATTKRQDRPLYEQIANELRTAIANGDLPPGAQLPSEKDLSQQYGVSRNTAQLAFRALMNEGLIVGSQGRTRIVRRREPLTLYASRSETRRRQRITTGTDHWNEDVRAEGREPDQIIEVAIVQAPSEIADKLNLKTGENVAVRRRLRLVDGQVWNLNDSYYPLPIVMGTKVLDPTDITGGVISYLNTLGYEQEHYVDQLTCRMPTPDEAQRLQIGHGIPVLVQTRTAYTKDGPLRVTVGIMPGDRHKIVYEIPA